MLIVFLGFQDRRSLEVCAYSKVGGKSKKYGMSAKNCSKEIGCLGCLGKRNSDKRSSNSSTLKSKNSNKSYGKSGFHDLFMSYN